MPNGMAFKHGPKLYINKMEVFGWFVCFDANLMAQKIC
jgi:hypothetical protein